MSELPEYLKGMAVDAVAPASAVRWRIVGLMMAASFVSWFNRVSMSVAGTERIMEEVRGRASQDDPDDESA